MGKREEMKNSIKRHQAKKATQGPPAAPVAAAATPTAPKKANPRSAAARDARARERGRLPEGTRIAGDLMPSGLWFGQLILTAEGSTCEVVKTFVHEADGFFRFAEELDVMFWNWMAAPGDEAVKAKLKWNPESPKPEPWPKEAKS